MPQGWESSNAVELLLGKEHKQHFPMNLQNTQSMWPAGYQLHS
jgi:hypothetical protein